MKRTIIFLGFLTFFASGWAFGQTTRKSYNGTLWKSLGPSTLALGTKSMYVFGFFDGFVRGYLDGSARTMEHVHASKKPAPPATEKFRAELLEEDAPLVSTFTSKNFSFSNADITSEMNGFYSDYRNAPVCWGNALLFSLGSLEGHPPTEQELNKARVAGATGGSCNQPVVSP